MPSGPRRKGREAALKILFHMDLAGTAADVAIDTYWETFDVEGEGDEYAELLVRGVADHKQEVDKAIQDASTRWRLERMASVDRNVLRIGAYELLFCDVPTGVVLDEAIELGKRYGSEDSGAFVNGVLDRIAQSVRRAGDDGDPPPGGTDGQE